MTDERVKEIVSQAVGQAFEQWAGAHPSLAAVIDRMMVTSRVVESLRDSEEYRSAIAAYRRRRAEADVLTRLTELATPLLTAILGG